MDAKSKLYRKLMESHKKSRKQTVFLTVDEFRKIKE